MGPEYQRGEFGRVPSLRKKKSPPGHLAIRVCDNIPHEPFNVYSFLKERERERERARTHKWGRGRERMGDKESEAEFRLQATSTGPEAGLELINRKIMT